MATKPENSSSSSIIPGDLFLIGIIFLLIIAGLGIFGGSIVSQYGGLLDWFYSKDWQEIFFTIKLIIIALDAILAIFTIITLRSFFNLQKKVTLKEVPIHIVPPKEEIRMSWEGIQNLASSKNTSDWNMAVLRADALLDNVLRDMGYEGETIADRLKIVDTHKLKSIELVWSAHRLRNIIAHDPITQHMHETIAHALKSYERALVELDLMEAEENEKKEIANVAGL
ncbi:MAG: hypothetical protein HYZ69_00320 [Candidatus Colwellbacteria bacterium]|nr:hypothetical protein [Candidatus Colwellbacteria bacterium]